MTGWVTVHAVVAGAAVGGGLWALTVGAFPPRPSLGEQLAKTLDPPPPPQAGTTEEGRLARLGTLMVPLASRAGIPGSRARGPIA
jgi:tight adherence protein C